MKIYTYTIRRLIRDEFGNNRKRFCKYCHISPGTLNPVLSGKRTPGYRFLMGILDYDPNTCITEILTGKCPCAALRQENENLRDLVEFLKKNL